MLVCHDLTTSEFGTRHSQLQSVMDMLLQSHLDEHYSLPVSLLSLGDWSTDLVHALLESPTDALLLMDAALVVAQQHVMQQKQLQHPAAVKDLVHLRVQSIPFHLDQSASAWHPSIGAIRSCHIDSLLTLAGTVVRTGSVTMMESHKVFACSRCHSRYTAVILSASATLECGLSQRLKLCAVTFHQ